LATVASFAIPFLLSVLQEDALHI